MGHWIWILSVILRNALSLALLSKFKAKASVSDHSKRHHSSNRVPRRVLTTPPLKPAWEREQPGWEHPMLHRSNQLLCTCLQAFNPYKGHVPYRNKHLTLECDVNQECLHRCCTWSGRGATVSQALPVLFIAVLKRTKPTDNRIFFNQSLYDHKRNHRNIQGYQLKLELWCFH